MGNSSLTSFASSSSSSSQQEQPPSATFSNSPPTRLNADGATDNQTTSTPTMPDDTRISSGANAIYPNDLVSESRSDSATSTYNGTFAYGGNSTTNTDENFHTTTSDADQEFSVNLFGNVLYPFRWLTLATLSSWLGPLSSAAMIIGCVMPYVPQYITIYKTKSCTGFSTFVCLTLLVANILRIAFWFGNRFELPLLIQSIIMIFAQLALLELCVRVKGSLNRRTIWSSHPRFFWRWTNFASYVEFILIFILILSGIVYMFMGCKLFMETLGYCALVSESMLGLPQVIRNFKNKSVKGMSLSMVLMWLAGDTFKTGYFITKAAPDQFVLCGLLQISIDIIILFQVCLYRQNAPIKMSVRYNGSPKEMIAI